jgi:hypothetical protein
MTEQQQQPEPPDMILVPPAPDGAPRPEAIAVTPEIAAELDADKK